MSSGTAAEPIYQPLVSPRDVPAPVHAPPFVAKPVSCYGRLKSGSIVLPLLLTALLVSLLQLLLSSSLDPTAPPSASVKPDDLQALLARDAKELALPKPSPPVPASPTLEQLLHIRDVVANLTLQEKITLLTGTALIHGYTGYVDGVPRLGVPALKMNDGPQGFRGPAGASTAWPCGLALAATFSPALVHTVAKATAKEFRTKGANVFLGPGLNIARVPGNGRTFEYICGEDPWLGKVMGFSYVTGMQSVRGVMATAKHFVNNDQETNRGSVDVVVDQATQHMTYYPPFAGAIQAGALAFMCSYNKINGHPACSSAASLLRDLHGDLGFDGYVMSDWFATKDTVESALGGLDMEMPIPIYYGATLLMAVRARSVPEPVVNAKVVRVLSAMARCGLLDEPPSKGKPSTNATSKAHADLARQAAGASTIVLKNARDVLPLRAVKSIVVIGDRAHVRALAVGGGSGHVEPGHVVTPLEGIKAATDAASTRVSYYDSATYKSKAAELARADVVIAAVGVASSEGTDRSSLSLGKDEDEVVEWAAARHANVVVCVVAPGAVLMPWADHANVSGVMLQFMPGQEAGHGLADVLFGKREPTARLPVSIPYEQAQVNFTKEQYPGVNLHAHYLERSEVGYRWFLAKNVKPRFPFGFGLQFAAVAWLGVFAGPKPAVLFVALRNTGTTEALELVQVYAALPPQAGEAAPRLVHFERFRVAPQRVRVVRLDLALGPLRSWKDGAWTLLPGRYTFSAGTSSQDIKGKVEAVL